MLNSDDIKLYIDLLEAQNKALKKQNKELQQELKNINAELKAYMDVNEDFKTAWEELKAENARLKEELTELEEKFLTLNGKSYSYYLTLQEIKEIAERQLLVTNVRTYQMVYYADFSEYRNEILQKITKAESEEV